MKKQKPLSDLEIQEKNLVALEHEMMRLQQELKAIERKYWGTKGAVEALTRAKEKENGTV